MKSFSSLSLFGALLAAAGKQVLGAALPQELSVIEERQTITDPDNAGCTGLANFMAPKLTLGNANGGVYKCIGSWVHGAYPKEIEARADDYMLRWMKITFTDGSVQVVGKDPGLDWHDRQLHVKWDPFVNTFSQFSLFDGGWGGGLGRLIIRLNGCSGDFCGGDAGAYVPNAKQFDVNRGADGSGMLLGFALRHGDGIDWMTPLFSKTAVEAVTLKSPKFDPTFEQLNEKPFSERKMQALQATHFLNNVASKSQATLWIDSAIHTETQHKVSNVKENGSELGGELGLAVKGEVEWSVGVPELVGASGKFSPEVNAKFIGKAIRKTIAGQENSRINSVTVRFRASHVVPAGGMVRCRTTVLQSRANLRFSATLVTRFKDQTSFSYFVTGMLDDANHSEAYTECADVDASELAEYWAAGVKPILVEASGTYCPNGLRITGSTLTDAQYNAVCPYGM